MTFLFDRRSTIERNLPLISVLLCRRPWSPRLPTATTEHDMTNPSIKFNLQFGGETMKKNQINEVSEIYQFSQMVNYS